MFAGIVALFPALDVGAGPEIVTVPLLFAGLGIGALASQLGSVTVSAVPDDQSAEVGGLQNTATNLGASLGTALAGSLLIAALSTSFLTGIEQNDAVPRERWRRRRTSSWPAGSRSSPTPTSRRRSRRPAPRRRSLRRCWTRTARLAWPACGLRSRRLGVIALLGLFFAGRIPTVQPGATPEPARRCRPRTSGGHPSG